MTTKAKDGKGTKPPTRTPKKEARRKNTAQAKQRPHELEQYRAEYEARTAEARKASVAIQRDGLRATVGKDLDGFTVADLVDALRELRACLKGRHRGAYLRRVFMLCFKAAVFLGPEERTDPAVIGPRTADEVIASHSERRAFRAAQWEGLSNEERLAKEKLHGWLEAIHENVILGPWQWNKGRDGWQLDSTEEEIASIRKGLDAVIAGGEGVLGETPRPQADTDAVSADPQRGMPSDLIETAVAVDKFSTSRSTIKRRIAAGNLKDYRSKDAATNSPRKLSETELARCFTRRHAPR